MDAEWSCNSIQIKSLNYERPNSCQLLNALCFSLSLHYDRLTRWFVYYFCCPLTVFSAFFSLIFHLSVSSSNCTIFFWMAFWSKYVSIISLPLFNSDVDEYGFKRDCHFDYAAYDNIMTNYYKVLTKRRMKWQSLMKNPPNFHNRKSAKLKRYVRKGIPGKRKKPKTVYILQSHLMCRLLSMLLLWIRRVSSNLYMYCAVITVLWWNNWSTSHAISYRWKKREKKHTHQQLLTIVIGAIVHLSSSESMNWFNFYDTHLRYTSYEEIVDIWYRKLFSSTHKRSKIRLKQRLSCHTHCCQPSRRSFILSHLLAVIKINQ